MQGFFDDVAEVGCPVSEIPRNWPQLRGLLGYENVVRYCAENRVKAQDLPAAGYANYLRAFHSELSGELDHAVERTVSEEATAGLLAFPIGLTGSVDGQRITSASYSRLLGLGSSVVVVSEPGGGKTYLTKMLARDFVRAAEKDTRAPVPVILRARAWGREFSSVFDGVKREIDDLVPGAAEGALREDLEAGRFVVLVDGLDEAPRDRSDLLYSELLRVARRTSTRVIATCREQDYMQDLAERFDECSIDPLTEDQVMDFALREFEGVPGGPNGAQFLHGLGDDLAQLVRIPLFLMMTVAVVKTKTGGAIPKNRAELYSEYAHALLEGWERRRGLGRGFEVDSGTKIAVLSRYARVNWTRPPDDVTFNRLVDENRGFWDGAKVREELLRSGLLSAERGGPEFFHPSFKEYFFALDLSREPDGELIRFVGENHSDDAYAEVFAFLVGLLGSGERRALVLDGLETRNLYLFRRCLDVVAGLGTTPDNVPLEFEPERYLGQLRSTYVSLVDTHLGEIRHLLRPWRPWVNQDEAGRYDVGVKGRLSQDLSSVKYQLNLVEKPCSSSDLVVLGYPSVHDPFGFRQCGLSRGGLSRHGRGSYSARELALSDLKTSVEETLKKRNLPLGDNHALGCEYVEGELKKLDLKARGKWVPQDLRGLSLLRSVEEVVEVLDRYLAKQSGPNKPGPMKFLAPRPTPPGGCVETLVDFPRMRTYLGHLLLDGVDPRHFLPPPYNVPAEEVARRSSGRGALVDKFYSDGALAVAVARFYDLYQSAYRWIAENVFPALKHQLGFYRVGPVRHRALISAT